MRIGFVLLASIFVASMSFSTVNCVSAEAKKCSGEDEAALQTCSNLYQDDFAKEPVWDDPDYVQTLYNPVGATELQLGSTGNGQYQNVATPVVFYLYSSIPQIIQLNYTGLTATFRLYKLNHYVANDVLMEVDDVGSSNQLVPLDAGSTYYLSFQTSVPGMHSFSITPQTIPQNFNDRGRYVIHLQAAPNSAFGSTFSIEKIEVSSASSVSIESTLYSYYLPTYIDALSSTLNFKYDINEDTRQVIADGRFSHYSAIAYVRSSVAFPIQGQNDQVFVVFSSASFITDTIVLTCAHSLLNYDSNSDPDRSSLSMRGFQFYPGASNYGRSDLSDYHDYFGTFSGTDAYLPISYLMSYAEGSSISRTGNDWAICLTEQTENGLYTHSTLGLTVPSETAYTNAKQIGYPALETYPETQNNRVWMWTTIPFSNTIYTENNNPEYFVSTTLFVNGGASGSPLFYDFTTYEHGYGVTHVVQIGIVSALSRSDYPVNGYYEFYKSFHTKVSHYIVNLCRYLGGLNDASI